MNPSDHLPSLLQNLFELSYFTDLTENSIIPASYNLVDDKQDYPRLSTRVPEEASPTEQDTPDTWTNGPASDDESTSEETSQGPVQTRMAEESSEEDEPVTAIKARTFSGYGTTYSSMTTNFSKINPRATGPRSKAGRKKMHRTKNNYGKRGNKRRERQLRQQQSSSFAALDVPMQRAPSSEDPDGGPLVRLGEGIIVDWKEQAWQLAFGGSPNIPYESQGEPTFIDIEKLRDPVLEQKRKTRMSRRTKGITLDECLDEFEKAEVLSEQDQWYCPRCKEHRRASKKFDLWKTPDILVVHLKRFSSSGYRRDKLDVFVDFPVENLDLTSRVVHKEDGKQEVYDLIAVDDHFGGLGGGHYTAWAKNFVDGKWYNYNGKSTHHWMWLCLSLLTVVRHDCDVTERSRGCGL